MLLTFYALVENKFCQIYFFLRNTVAFCKKTVYNVYCMNFVISSVLIYRYGNKIYYNLFKKGLFT